MREITINVPDGVSGNWAVQSFIVSEEDAKITRLRAIFQGGRGSVPVGNYKYLKRNGQTIMSNTPDEIRDFGSFIKIAKGSVLINGLGIGVVLKAILEKQEVTKVIVIEKSRDVIKLSAPTYEKDERVTIINGDAFEYQPPKGERYDCVWHDIWDVICSDNLEGMKTLHRKYGRICDYQESWCRDRCKDLL